MYFSSRELGKHTIVSYFLFLDSWGNFKENKIQTGGQYS